MTSPHAIDMARLASDLADAVARDQLFVRYQPQMDLDTGRMVAVEALCRWRHPELGVIPPDVFIPMAEQSGDIVSIGRFMVETVCRLLSEWQGGGIGLEVAVNVSAAQLAPAFYEHLSACVAEEAVEPGRLAIEITESREIPDLAMAARDLAGIRSLGVGLSIDDFGRHHSTLKQVMGLPATELKIDRSIVQEEDEDTERMLAELVSFVQRRGFRVVAEGVENAEQLARVRRIHCDRAQGFFLAAPMSQAEVEELIAGEQPAMS